MTAGNDVFVLRLVDRWAVSQGGVTVAEFGNETDEDPFWLACRWASRLAGTNGSAAWLIDRGQVHRIRDE